MEEPGTAPRKGEKRADDQQDHQNGSALFQRLPPRAIE
jgi:hypothetical protein